MRYSSRNHARFQLAILRELNIAIMGRSQDVKNEEAAEGSGGQSPPAGSRDGTPVGVWGKAFRIHLAETLVL